MAEWTTEIQHKISTLAAKYSISEEAVSQVLQGLQRGGGTMVQFSHPDLGGSGQWMQGGMVMIADMFNASLKDTVNSLCSELSALLFSEPVLTKEEYKKTSANWWGEEFGSPSSTGSQNEMAYAIFPDKKRLLLKDNNLIHIYHTKQYKITGVSQQQQNATRDLKFSATEGEVSLSQFSLLKTVHSSD